MASFYDSASIITIPSGYKAGTLYSQIPTDGTGDMAFTRTGDTATRVNSAGIIERCITNVVLQSNNFSNASWTKSNVTIAGSIADPNGGTTAFSMAGTSATSNSKNINQFPFAVVNQPKTLSIYAKANTHSFIQIRNSDPTNFSNFDLTTGTFSAGSTALAIMTSIGGGWYRCSISYSSAATGFNIHLVDSLAAAHAASSTTTNSVYIWRAQAESEDIPTNYIDTTTAAVTQGPVTNLPRLDYLGSTCPQLLMEPTRTNLLPYSQMFDLSGLWAKEGISVSGNVTASPDGYTNADIIQEDSTSSPHRIYRSITWVSGTTYSISCFVKQGVGNRRFMIFLNPAVFAGNLMANFNLQTQTFTTTSGSIVGKMENYGNGWYRCTAISTATANGTTSLLFYLRQDNALSISNYTGDGTSSLYLWGAQVEAGAYATSYIPTTAATVTRNEDYCRKTSISSLIGQTEGTLFIHFRYNKNLDSFINIGDGTSGNRITIGSQIANNTARAFIANGSSTQTDIVSSTNSLVVGNYYKMAVAYKQNDIAFYLNGSLVATDTTATIPTVSNFYYGGTGSTALFVEPIVQVLLFKTRLSNADLATLTTL